MGMTWEAGDEIVVEVPEIGGDGGAVAVAAEIENQAGVALFGQGVCQTAPAFLGSGAGFGLV